MRSFLRVVISPMTLMTLITLMTLMTLMVYAQLPESGRAVCSSVGVAILFKPTARWDEARCYGKDEMRWGEIR